MVTWALLEGVRLPKKKKKGSLKEKRRKVALKRQRSLEAERLRREREPKKSKGLPKAKIFVAFMFILIIAIYGAWQYTYSPSNNKPPSNNNSNINEQKAPLFTLTDIDENTVSLEDLRGKVVVLDFFFIQCGYCDDEFLELMKIHQSYSADDIAIISISIDTNYDTITRLKEFRTGPNQYSNLNYEIGWILVRDTNNLATVYNISAAPTTVIIDREGNLSPNSPYVGLTDFSTLSNEINMLLND
jgi:cytochrome oxidase Cu insertion factor (SCO1/SenC/PrrC family)